MKQAIKLFLFLTLLVFTYSDTAIVTYHLYKKYDSLTTVSCSDGANGIMSWGYKDISSMFPYVTAWQPSSWNSPQCGSCAKIMWNGKFTYVTVIDQCGVINSAYSHFDMSKQAFLGLFGQQGYAKGTMTANFTIVASKYCPGNKKGVKSGTPLPWENENQLPQFDQQQQSDVNNQDSNSYQNPLWVRGGKNQNLNVQQSQNVNELPKARQQQNNDQNNQWVQSENFGGNDVQRTQFGGISYDKMNARNQQDRN